MSGLLGGPEGLGTGSQEKGSKEGREGQERVETEQGTGPHEREGMNGMAEEPSAGYEFALLGPRPAAAARQGPPAWPEKPRCEEGPSTSGGKTARSGDAAPASGWGAAAPQAPGGRRPPGPQALWGRVRRGVLGEGQGDPK